MGGDRAPEVIVQGALEALDQAGEDLELVLVGRKEKVEEALGSASDRLRVVDARDVVAMGDQPSVTVRKKKDSSISVALRLQKQGEVQGFVSAGNTGAVVANALFTLGRLSGVERPGIATCVPTGEGGCILLDVGANIDCRPSHLYQYGVMGACYADRVLRRPEPRVGLLNVGEESSKGTELVQAAYRMLEAGDLNFVGNVEGRDIFAGSVDVVVCDGFVGNVVLKFTESVVDMVYAVMKQALTSTVRGKVGGLLLKPAFKQLQDRFDYAEYGGAPLLGLQGVCTIAHGSSSERAIKNAILATRRYIKYDVDSVIKERLVKRGERSSETA
jgi:glycerol-3-phosphate acyltransferase PlsX